MLIGDLSEGQFLMHLIADPSGRVSSFDIATDMSADEIHQNRSSTGPR